MTKREPEALLPLTPAMFYVLVALADGQTHGYAMLKEVEQLTSGAVRLSTGTLYGIIKRLLADGLIREAALAPNDDERRRSYELTPFRRGPRARRRHRRQHRRLHDRQRRPDARAAVPQSARARRHLREAARRAGAEVRILAARLRLHPRRRRLVHRDVRVPQSGARAVG